MVLKISKVFMFVPWSMVFDKLGLLSMLRFYSARELMDIYRLIRYKYRYTFLDYHHRCQIFKIHISSCLLNSNYSKQRRQKAIHYIHALFSMTKPWNYSYLFSLYLSINLHSNNVAWIILDKKIVIDRTSMSCRIYKHIWFDETYLCK